MDKNTMINRLIFMKKGLTDILPNGIYTELASEMIKFIDNIFELLDAQTSRILNFDKIPELQLGDVIWEECKDEQEIKPCMVISKTEEKLYLVDSAGNTFIKGLKEDELKSPYINSFRYWSFKPTDEQRKNIPWQDDKAKIIYRGKGSLPSDHFIYRQGCEAIEVCGDEWRIWSKNPTMEESEAEPWTE